MPSLGGNVSGLYVLRVFSQSFGAAFRPNVFFSFSLGGIDDLATSAVGFEHICRH